MTLLTEKTMFLLEEEREEGQKTEVPLAGGNDEKINYVVWDSTSLVPMAYICGNEPEVYLLWDLED